jgi:hypothetical protein
VDVGSSLSRHTRFSSNVHDRGERVMRTIFFSVCCLVLAVSFSPICWAQQVSKRCFQVDLRRGASTPAPSFAEFVVSPQDSDSDGWYEAVIKVRISATKQSPEAVQFSIAYDGVPTGMTVDIGDSQTSDGFSGDQGSQSNDAEVQIGGIRGDPEFVPVYDDLQAFGKDGINEARGDPTLARIPNIVRQGETVVLTVSNERIGFSNDAVPTSGSISSSWLYALAGQRDSEGPVNYDVYAAFNRAVAGPDRLGSGVGKVEICGLHRIS